MKILILLFFLTLFKHSYSQNNYEKYKNAYTYIDSSLKVNNENLKLNVSPLIKYISVTPFENEIEHMNAIPTLKDYTQFYKLFYFQSFVDNSMDSLFNNQIGGKFLEFSKPAGNILSVLLYNEKYESTKIEGRLYFGTIIKYVFIFNDQNNVTKVLSCKINSD